MCWTENPRSEPIRSAVEASGLRTRDHTLFDHPGSQFLGPEFRIATCELAYRRPEPGLLLLILYRRLERTGTMASPFADLLWFLRLVTQPRFGLRRIMGYVDTSEYAHENGLSDARLTLFYQRFFAAQRIRYDGSSWLYRDVDDDLRALLQRVAHKATRLPPTGQTHIPVGGALASAVMSSGAEPDERFHRGGRR